MLHNKIALLTEFFKDEKKNSCSLFIKPSMKPKVFFAIIFLMMVCPILFLLMLGILRGKTYFSYSDFILTTVIIVSICTCLFIELLGCHIIVTENGIEVVSKIFHREFIRFSDIVGYNDSFSLFSNQYPSSLVIGLINKNVYINLFCYSKNDINSLKRILEKG